MFVRSLVLLALCAVFLYSVIFCVIKWSDGKTGVTARIRRQENRVLPTVTMYPLLATTGRASRNMTENYLLAVPIQKNVLRLEHYLQTQNGYNSYFSLKYIFYKT